MAHRHVADHGTRRRYQQGCKCSDCKDGNARYQREWRSQWHVVIPDDLHLNAWARRRPRGDDPTPRS